MKKIIVGLLLLLFFVEAVASYPISPRPLRKLVMESEFIVVGRVLEIRESRKKDKNWDPSSTARIEIMEVLQGSISDPVIDVPYHANFICPAPAHYEAGTTVLTFLKKGDDGRYYTHALSYGSKTLSPPDIATYKSRIQEIQQIIAIQDADTKFMETIEWLVKCTENQATRWEGTFELSPESDFMSYYSQSEPEPFRHLLSESQRQRLTKALLETADPQDFDFGLVDLVYPFHEPEVRSFLLNGLKNLSERQLWFAEEFMTRLMYGKQSAEMEKLVEDFSELQFKQDADEKLRAIVADFIVLAER